MLKRLTSSSAPKLFAQTKTISSLPLTTLRTSQKQSLSTFSKNVISFKQQEKKQESKFNNNNKRFYNAGTYNSSTTSSSPNILVPAAAAVAMIGGGIILYQTLNKPISRNETSSSTTTATTTTMRSTSIPMHVRSYLFETYKWVVGGLGITALSAFLTFRSGLVFRIMSMGWMSSIGLFIGTAGAMIATQMVDPRNKALKLTGFTTFNALMGLTLSSLAFFGPALLIRAGMYTLGVFGAMSFIAMTAKEEQFLFLGGPLFVGLTVLCLASLSSFFIPARYSTALSVIENLVIYGGLALFTLYLLYDTQKIMKHGRIYHERREMALGTRQSFSADISSEELRDPALADVMPSVNDMEKSRSIPQPDYINESIHLYLNLINIFIRMVMILANRDSKRRR